MFRYVIGDKYDKKTDFNVLNNNPEENENDENSGEQKNEAFFIASNGAEGSIVLNYDASAVGEYTVTITNLGGRTYTLTNGANNTDAQ